MSQSFLVPRLPGFVFQCHHFLAMLVLANFVVVVSNHRRYYSEQQLRKESWTRWHLGWILKYIKEFIWTRRKEGTLGAKEPALARPWEVGKCTMFLSNRKCSWSRRHGNLVWWSWNQQDGFRSHFEELWLLCWVIGTIGNLCISQQALVKW